MIRRVTHKSVALALASFGVHGMQERAMEDSKMAKGSNSPEPEAPISEALEDLTFAQSIANIISTAGL